MCRCPKAGWNCEKCRGHTTMQEKVNLSFYVERGQDEGSVVLVKNAGDVSECNAPGDVEIVIVAKEDGVFHRSGSDLHMTLRITLREALVGFKKVFKNYDGTDITVESSKPSQFDDVVVLKNKGLPKYLFPDEFGDLYVHLAVGWPKDFTDEQRERIHEILQ